MKDSVHHTKLTTTDSTKSLRHGLWTKLYLVITAVCFMWLGIYLTHTAAWLLWVIVKIIITGISLFVGITLCFIGLAVLCNVLFSRK